MTTLYRIDCLNQDDFDPAREWLLRQVYKVGTVRLYSDREQAEATAARLNVNDFGGVYEVVEVPEENLGPDDRRLFRPL